MGRSVVIHTRLQTDKAEVCESSLAQQSMKLLLNGMSLVRLLYVTEFSEIQHLSWKRKD